MFVNYISNLWSCLISALRSILETNVYGQPLVLDTVVRAIRAHWTNPNPTKVNHMR